MQENDMKKAKTENPLDKFLAVVMDADSWEAFKAGDFAMILKDLADFNDFMEQCEKHEIMWASGASAKEFIPDPLCLNKPAPVAVGKFGNNCGKIGYSSCVEAWLEDGARNYYIYSGDQESKADKPEQPKIGDSGSRREFATGAVRDIAEGKGRCDLLPLDVLGTVMQDTVFTELANFVYTHEVFYLYNALHEVSRKFWSGDEEMFLEAAKHFEDGAKKYGEYNWQKGIPVHCYVDSAVRHYLKHRRGDRDEPHDRAFVWNIVCCIWTMKHRPEMDDLPKREVPDESVSQ